MGLNISTMDIAKCLCGCVALIIATIYFLFYAAIQCGIPADYVFGSIALIFLILMIWLIYSNYSCHPSGFTRVKVI
jgi:hypothetical protein